MAVAFFLHVDGPGGQRDALQAWAGEVFGPALLGTGQTQIIETYAPLSVDDYYLGNEDGKQLIVEAGFSSPGKMQAALNGARIENALADMPGKSDHRVSAEAFTARHFPLLDGSKPARLALVSFVVRYYRPVDDEIFFNHYYFEHHPPIMQHFPRIRNILCYEPVEWLAPRKLAPTNSFLGNEIVFDSVADLQAALDSEARHKLREDYHGFPPHAGETSHHAMMRRKLK